MKTSSIKNFDELPLFLNAQLVSRALGISPSSAYELLHEDGFPSLRIGSRLVVPKEQFRLWVERQTGGTGRINTIHRAIQSKTTFLCRMKFSPSVSHQVRWRSTAI